MNRCAGLPLLAWRELFATARAVPHRCAGLLAVPVERNLSSAALTC
ncbi:unknown [Haloarcula marismortui ATCC 43049]|uniref:Uncharacterized protein n=1 Tax=Haloarcula marismortui (strain ATCC 43049 / DSM 3752 / JCM 8966 / VKM B-1809) TaxID=272569 RepID=Q5V1E5_HALMA|nr:unknown [Haloarcula marismortui ATCC 43049]